MSSEDDRSDWAKVLADDLAPLNFLEESSHLLDHQIWPAVMLAWQLESGDITCDTFFMNSVFLPSLGIF